MVERPPRAFRRSGNGRDVVCSEDGFVYKLGAELGAESYYRCDHIGCEAYVRLRRNSMSSRYYDNVHVHRDDDESLQMSGDAGANNNLGWKSSLEFIRINDPSSSHAAKSARVVDSFARRSSLTNASIAANSGEKIAENGEYKINFRRSSSAQVSSLEDLIHEGERHVQIRSVLAEGTITNDVDNTVTYQRVIDLVAESSTVYDVVQMVFQHEVEPLFPTSQFVPTVSTYEKRFRKSVHMNANYRTVTVAENGVYTVDFRNRMLGCAENRFCRCFPEHPTFSVESTSKKQITVEAFFKDSSYESPALTKHFEWKESALTVLEVICSLFYEDTEWHRFTCYVTAEKRAKDSAEFVNLLAEYEKTECEAEARYRIRFFDANSVAKEKLPRFSIELHGGESGAERAESTEVECNYVKFTSPPQNIHKPRMSVPFVVPCPSQCSVVPAPWHCEKCGNQIFYGFSEFLFCLCGAHPKLEVAFQCGIAAHGDVYAKYASGALEALFTAIPRCEVKNVVLLGETGAGKSTWIDAIANYILHTSFDDAIASGVLEAPIPTQFTFAGTAVRVGGDSTNENHAIGASATQHPKTYTFVHRNVFYRFIDVPGVNDSRGVQQDKKNFQMIMQELYNYDKIHAFCILHPSGVSRLTTSMRYCINELFTHLHQDAAKNIVFCFTKARADFYRAGKTQEILQDHLRRFREKRAVDIRLDDRSAFYFDNESFRFLCAHHNGVDLQAEKADYEKSWNVSAESTNAVLAYIAELPPHNLRDMRCVNDAKRVILELTPISAEVTKNIQTNIRIVEAKREELQQMTEQTVDLESQLTIKQTTLAAFPLPYPRTVCAAAKCIETKAIPGTKESQTLYKTVCHDECYLKDVEPGKYPNPSLQSCFAMFAGGGTSCAMCGCSWDAHLHILYEQQQLMIDVKNAEVEALLNSKKSGQVRIDDVIKGLEARLRELAMKETRIKEICAKFIVFLNKNAIAVTNDAYKEYLEQSLLLAKYETEISGDGAEKVAQLEKHLTEYNEEVAIINEHLNDGTEKITVASIDEMKRELRGMDELGKQFGSFLDALGRVETSYERHDEIHLRNDGCSIVAKLKDKIRKKRTSK